MRPGTQISKAILTHATFGPGPSQAGVFTKAGEKGEAVSSCIDLSDLGLVKDAYFTIYLADLIGSVKNTGSGDGYP